MRLEIAMKALVTVVLYVFALARLIGQESEAPEPVTLLLENGDRLSGFVVTESEDELMLEHSGLGQLTIKRALIAEIERERPVEEAVPIEALEEELPEPRGWFWGLASIARLEGWDKRFEFGTNTQRGKADKVDFSLRYDMTRKAGQSDYRLSARMYYGETNEKKSTDRFESNFRWRYDAAPGFFYESYSEYSYNQIKKIDHSVIQSLGLGRRLVNRQNLKFSSGVGASGRFREDGSIKDGFIYLLDLFQDVDYRLNERIRLVQDIRIGLPPEATDRYEYEFNASMVSEITEALNLSIRYQLEYDRSQPVDLRAEQRLISSIGIKF